MKCGAAKASRGMTRREFLTGLAGSTVLAAIPCGARAEESWHERMRPLMATYVSIAISWPTRSEALRILGDCFTEIERCIAMLSSWDDLSEISRLSEMRSSAYVSIPTRRLLVAASWASRRTGGKFTPYIGQLTELWRSAKAASTRPDRIDIREAMRKVEGTEVSLAGSAVTIHGPGRIDVGGIGKGLIADLACEYLASRGVSAARVACSGDLRFLGTGPWRVDTTPIAGGKSVSLALSGAVAVSTSGGSENFWDVEGERFHHLIDPQSGEPGRANRQVTVIAPTGAQADALSSGLFFLPAASHSSVMSDCVGCTAVTIDSKGKTSFAGAERSVNDLRL